MILFNEQLNDITENKQNDLVNGESDHLTVNIKNAEHSDIAFRIEYKDNDLGKQMLMAGELRPKF